MNTLKKVLILLVLPTIAPLLVTPNIIETDFKYVLILILNPIFLILSGIFLLRGFSRALTLSIFLVGLNAIMRIMMLFPHATFLDGSADILFVIASIASIALSIYLVLRLDKNDIRALMFR